MTGYPELPFGGYKDSGEGRENGRQAIHSFTQTKTIQLQVGPNRTRWVPNAGGAA
jgi:betaine-aldehyde dehydrogenase